MAFSRRKRGWLLGLMALALFLSALAVAGHYFAARILKSRVEEALGANGTVGEIRLGFSSVELLDLRVKAGEGWPTGDELRARRVVIRPDLATLVSRKIRIDRIDVEDAYISILRRRDGKTKILPGLLGKPPDPDLAGKTAKVQKEVSVGDFGVRLGGVQLSGAVIEFFDASVRQTPHRLRLEQVRASLGDISIPDLAGQTSIDIVGIVKGVRQDGRFSIQGTAEFSTLHSEIDVKLHGVDLLSLQPYLLKATEGGVRRGTLDLDLHSRVRDHHLKAPGVVTLSNLELASGGRFMGMPRALVIAMLKDKKGRIALKFTVDGNVNDPAFSLNETFSDRIGASLAGVLGIGLEGLTQSVGMAGSGVVKGLSDTMKGLLGGRK